MSSARWCRATGVSGVRACPPDDRLETQTHDRCGLSLHDLFDANFRSCRRAQSLAGWGFCPVVVSHINIDHKNTDGTKTKSTKKIIGFMAFDSFTKLVFLFQVLISEMPVSTNSRTCHLFGAYKC
jgi:hypothetical protein